MIVAVAVTAVPAGTRESEVVTATASAGIVMVSAACAAGALPALAVTTTERSPGGTVAGAVYVTHTPLVVVDGENVPQGGVAQDADQDTTFCAESLIKATLM